MQITFFDEDEEHWQQLEKIEQEKETTKTH